jgi:hypothetical protein
MKFERVLALVAMTCGMACGKTSRDSPTGSASAGRANQPGSNGEGGVAGVSDAGPGDTSPGGAGPGDTGRLGCADWRLQTTPGNPSSATIVDGALVLERPADTESPLPGIYNNADVAVSQDGLSGDFDITVVWENFQPGDAVPFIGPRVEAGVWRDDLSEGYLVQATASVGQTTGTASIVQHGELAMNFLDPSPSPESLVGASGVFHITRTGASVTVESMVNGQVVSIQSSEPFSDEPLTLFISIDKATGGDETTAASSIEISSVVVEGGGGRVKSDDFTCP